MMSSVSQSTAEAALRKRKTVKTSRSGRETRTAQENNSHNNSVYKFRAYSTRPLPGRPEVTVTSQPGRDKGELSNQRCDLLHSKPADQCCSRVPQRWSSPPITYSKYRSRCRKHQNCTDENINYRVQGKPHQKFSNQNGGHQSEPKVISCIRQSAKREPLNKPQVIRCLLQANNRTPLKIFAHVIPDQHQERVGHSGKRNNGSHVPKIYYNDESSSSSRYRASQSLRSSVTLYDSPRSSHDSIYDQNNALDTTLGVEPGNIRQEEYSSRTESSNGSVRFPCSRSVTPISPVRASPDDTDQNCSRLVFPLHDQSQTQVSPGMWDRSGESYLYPNKRRSRRNLAQELYHGPLGQVSPMVSRLLQRKSQGQKYEPSPTNYCIEGMPRVITAQNFTNRRKASPVRREDEHKSVESSKLNHQLSITIPDETVHRLTRRFSCSSPITADRRSITPSPERKVFRRNIQADDSPKPMDRPGDYNQSRRQRYNWESQEPDRTVKVYLCEGDPRVFSCGCYQPSRTERAKDRPSSTFKPKSPCCHGNSQAAGTDCGTAVAAKSCNVGSGRRVTCTVMDCTSGFLKCLQTLLFFVLRFLFILLVYLILLYTLAIYIHLGSLARFGIIIAMVMCFVCLIFEPNDLIIHLFSG